MKKVNLLLMGLLVMGLAFSCSKTADETANPVKEKMLVLKSTYGDLTFPLIAGQSIEVGYLSFQVWDDVEGFTVCYNLVGQSDWYFTKIDFHIANSLEGIPTNPAGAPIIGQFDYSRESSDPTIPLDDLCFDIYFEDGVLECDMELWFAAHAVVYKYDMSQEETVWAQGELFRKRQGWAMYNSVTLPCEGTGGCTTETAYGGDGNYPWTPGPGKGAWWYYYEVSEGSPQNIWAGKTDYAGLVSVDQGTDFTVITITFADGWGLQPVNEGVKIEGYTTLPDERPAAGLFTTYKGNDLVVTVPNFPYYVIHLDVQYCQ